MTDNDHNLRAILETLDSKARNTLRRVLIHDQSDRDAISSDLLRYRDGRGDDWADIIDFLTMIRTAGDGSYGCSEKSTRQQTLPLTLADGSRAQTLPPTTQMIVPPVTPGSRFAFVHETATPTGSFAPSAWRCRAGVASWWPETIGVG